MQDFQIREIEKSILSTFRSPAAAEKYNQLVAEKEALMQKQSSGEYDRLKGQLEALQAAQIDSTERYAGLSKQSAEKVEKVRQIQSNLDVVTGDLSATNFELAVLSNQISQNRAEIKNAERQLKSFESSGVSE